MPVSVSLVIEPMPKTGSSTDKISARALLLTISEQANAYRINRLRIDFISLPLFSRRFVLWSQQYPAQFEQVLFMHITACPCAMSRRAQPGVVAAGYNNDPCIGKG